MRTNDNYRTSLDPIMSRRSVSGMGIRFIYGSGIILLGLYLLWYFGRSILFLEGSGVVTAPLYEISTPYLARIEYINVVPGINITEHDILARIKSPQFDQTINDIDHVLVEQSQKEADLRIRFRIANATATSAQDRLSTAEEAVRRLEGKGGDSVSLLYRMDVFRERAQALVQKSQADAEVDEIQMQLPKFKSNTQLLEDKIHTMSHDFNNGYVSSSIAGVVGTKIAHSGEIVRPGDTIAEIYDMSELYIIWHIPAFYLKMPHIGDGVYVQYGQNIFPAYVYEIKNIAEPANETNQSILRDKQQQQIIYVKLKDRSSLLPINAPVTIRMNYNNILDRLMDSFTGKPQ